MKDDPPRRSSSRGAAIDAEVDEHGEAVPISVGALHDAVTEWFASAQREGWLNPADAAPFQKLERGTPADLFEPGALRPLVVALFGGTGVGKSSLLNRLAGRAVARVGVERPTSHEVTLHAHESAPLADLPSDLPLERVRVSRHDHAHWRDVVWLDMPDIDSTAQENRDCALRWLPHIDLLIYVVSPERYRDDVGWRLLLSHGHRHAWLFVLNRMDEGDASQPDDWAATLRAAGFDNPLLLCTCCLPDARAARDEFDQIQAQLELLRQEHGVRELERLGYAARLRELRAALIAASKRFGDGSRWDLFAQGIQERWRQTRELLRQGVEWPLSVVATRFAARGGQGRSEWLGAARAALRLGRTSAPAQDGELAAAQRGAEDATAVVSAGDSLSSAPLEGLDDARLLTEPLWDAWAQGQLEAVVDAAEVEAAQLDLPAAPPRRALDACAAASAACVRGQVEQHVRLALSRPQTALREALRRVTGFLSAFLPLVAVAWVAYVVVARFHLASIGQGAFLDAPFVLHAALLVLLAWALPYGLDRALRPSIQDVMARALRRGFAAGLEEVGARLERTLSDVRAEADTYRKQAGAIVSRISGASAGIRPPRSPTLRRMMTGGGAPLAHSEPR
jgi:hypothetical protein